MSRMLLLLILVALTAEAPGREPPIDATTLHKKVLCGYQGWFRCPGDGTGLGWLHWSRNRERISPRSITVEMWPDMTEYSEAERYLVPGFRTADNQPVQLFSSVHPRTVARHFDWMRQYGIDGVFVQRFLVNLDQPSFDTVLGHVRDSARNSGRVYAVCYDLTGTPADQLFDRLSNDWTRLVKQEKITGDDRYLHHEGKPVVFIWGLFSDRFEAAIAHRLLDFLQQAGPCQATVVGGCPWYWRKEQNPEWARAWRRLDVLSPWNVGNYEMRDGQAVAATGSWPGDRQACREAGQELLPVVYPGFGWANLQGPGARDVTIPRRGGAFFWEQFVAARKLEIDMVYVAMFDEVDEATAIFKVTNNPPVEPTFQTLDGLPSDWYLRLTGEGSRLIRGEREPVDALPIRP